VAVALVALVVGGVFSSPAAGHTRLTETVPANRTIAAEAPERLTLVFAEAVDPRTVQLEIIALSGETLGGARLLTAPGADATVIEFALPDLADGVFGLSWVTVGPDGHRVAGEVVLGVGVVDGEAVASSGFARVSPLDRTLEVLNGVGRYLWYLGLALVAGALLALSWRLRAGSVRSVAAAVLTATARRALTAGALVLHAAIVLRTGATVTLVTRGYGDGSLREHLRLALVEGTGRTLLLAVVATGALAIWAPRLGRTRSGWALLQAGLGTLALVAFGASPGHTATLSEDPFGIWVATLHVAAASAWLGPLLIVGWTLASPAWQERPALERAVAVSRLFDRFAPVAAGAFVILVLTGLRSAWLLAGAELLGGSGYAATLIVKLSLVALVVLPLGLHHDRRVGWLARRRQRRGRPPLAVTPRTLRLEAWTLGGVLAVAALLTGLNPAVLGGGDPAPSRVTTVAGEPPQGAADGAALLSDEPPAGVAECAERTVGKANCYRDYFAEVMRNEGADVAVAEIDALSRTDDYVSGNCHQVVHDLGNDAVVWYGDVGTALTYQGSACWSGYYHGVVEYAISGFSNSELVAELPVFCTEQARREYSFSHFNCVHGLGHGIMQILGGDLFGTIPYCEVFSDPWEQSTCMNGALMENMINGQQGNPRDLRTDDLVYPCNAVPDVYVADCFATQTSWMLHNIGYRPDDFAEVFAICDGVRADMVDDCYRALGRDISSVHDQDPNAIVRLCSLGDPDLQDQCYVGAASNTIFNNHDAVQATVICESIRTRFQQACFEARDRVAATL
jgi:putative copper export protein/methionine-rich copper-binding protein CopC